MVLFQYLLVALSFAVAGYTRAIALPEEDLPSVEVQDRALLHSEWYTDSGDGNATFKNLPGGRFRLVSSISP